MSSTECAICLDSLKNNLSALRCGHTFHSDCIAKWLVNQSACPCCKKTANHRTHVIPLYIDLTQRSDAESSSHTDANSQGNEKQLQTSNHQLRGQLDSCANQLKESRLENERLRKEASAQASKIRSYRSLQSVIDLQRRLSTEDARDRMRHWAMLPRDELGLITASLFEKYRDLTG
ncbi:hypothetical protein DM01DRAFT_1178649 [Hesseltinella vesiculosa]|uniref:RING-type domain-containing protein n=1 Tax=Hesseltinella vesiculosa TaxID=101127 RepID=A0A1X2G4K1_9FUNG|nr:hypothetical protein DM01DRAFT_1178649 [Hesseltinella vesiculosa]